MTDTSTRRQVGLATALAVAAAVVAGCSSGAADREPDPTESASHSGGHGMYSAPKPEPPSRPLRSGERRVTVQMDEPYTPSAPTGVGTDDYRCFLLDPGLDRDVYLTGTDVRPGDPAVVHHVILFHIPPTRVGAAERLDESTEDPGWTCFGGSGLERGASLDDAPWLGAWAPGSGETVQRAGHGQLFAQGSRVVMQVHYNLLAGARPDVSAAQLRVAPVSSSITPVHTLLLPAPVELPCRRGHQDGPLCERDAALADVKERFGQGPGSFADLLHLLCGGPPRPGPVQSCGRPAPGSITVTAAAGHMHLLGRSLTIEANPGTRRAHTLLDIPAWNFDDQRARPVEPTRLTADDTLRVTCRHSQEPRDVLPAFEGQPERYVLWGEGTTDEMCLGIVQFVRPD